MNTPVLIAASGPRCGSTLIQRLLSSSRRMFVWGEHDGLVRDLLTLTERAEAWNARHHDTSRREFSQWAYNSFMANLAPSDDVVRRAAGRFLREWFGSGTPVGNCERWGLKETRYTAEDCAGIESLVGPVVVVHVTRRAHGVAASLDAWEREQGPWSRGDTDEALARWVRINTSFRPSNTRRLGLRVVTVTYEDMVRSPTATTERLCSHVGLSPEELQPEVLDTRVHASGEWGRTRRRLRPLAELPPATQAACAAMMAGPGGWPWQDAGQPVEEAPGDDSRASRPCAPAASVEYASHSVGGDEVRSSSAH